MNVLVYFLSSLAIFGSAIRFYSKYLSKEVGVDPQRPTPAVQINDGKDYVPTKFHVLFAHHFSSIAGAGPIIGPTMGILYGFVPGWLWIVLGGIFIGAVHDFTSLFVSIREGGKSMAEVARKTLGNTGFVLVILFTIVMIVLVTSAFLSATATSLTSKWPISKLLLPLDQTLLKTEMTDDGTVLGIIGGIASMSVVTITFFSPLLGYLIYGRRIKIYLAYSLAAPICITSVVVGIYYPITFSPETWMIIISVYVLFAAGTPVWMILQPRDFINVQILYLGILALVFSLLLGGASGLSLKMPSFNIAEGVKNLGFVWPMLFITIACGAISGFHSLVTSGTDCKQLSRETEARKIGYNGMILESVLALSVLLALGSVLVFSEYKSIVWPEVGRSNPILAFALAAGKLMHQSLGISMALGSVFGILLVEGFVITTLDTAVRLNRYLFEELWGLIFKKVPALFKIYWFNSASAVILMWVLAYFNTFASLWPIFGTANQLLAALALIAISTWLYLKGKRNWFTLLPAIFMILTTTVALLILFFQNYLPRRNLTLMITDILLLVLSLGVVYLSIKTVGRILKDKKSKSHGPILTA
jgi:carbon starvation protein